MSKNSKPRKWTDVYPQGTTEGNEEQKLFISLARNPKFEWRSVKALAKDTGLSVERVEEILNKYYKKGMVFQSPKNEDNWGYWERVPEMLEGDAASLTKSDQNDRIDKALGATVDRKAVPVKASAPKKAGVPVAAKSKP